MIALRLVTALLPLAAQGADSLEKEALALARARDFQRLEKLLTNAAYLTRLDDPSVARTRRFGHVMAELASGARADTVELCLRLAANPAFLAEPDRMTHLLPVVAAVKPMGAKTAALFRTTNEQGYFATNARLLAANGSPVAIELFVAMVLDTRVRLPRRIDALRGGIVPRRTELQWIDAARAIFDRTKEPALAHAAAASVFDFGIEWFGPHEAPAQPAWDKASALRAASGFADAALRRGDLPSDLRRAVERERGVVRKLGGF